MVSGWAPRSIRAAIVAAIHEASSLSFALVSVTLPLAAHRALTVPRDAIVLRTAGAFVMRIDSDNKAPSVAVEVAEASGEKVSVRGDLNAGDRIAVRGAEALNDGERVTILSGP